MKSHGYIEKREMDGMGPFRFSSRENPPERTQLREEEGFGAHDG